MDKLLESEAGVAQSPLDNELIYRELKQIQEAVRGIDATLRGDGRGDPGLVGRLRALEAWVESKRSLEKLVVGTLITMFLTGAVSLILMILRLSKETP